MASVWIGSWGLFAVDEVGASLTHILEKNDLEINSVLKPGYVMHEKNGVKFMIKSETAEKMGVVTLEMECDSAEFWDNIEYEVDLETLEFVVDFNNLNYRDYKIRNLYVITEPYSPDAADWNHSTKGFEYHNFTKTLVPHYHDVATVRLPLYKSNFASLEKTYPLDIKLEATSMGTSSSVACVKEKVTSITVERFRAFENMAQFFAEGIGWSGPLIVIVLISFMPIKEELHISEKPQSPQPSSTNRNFFDSLLRLTIFSFSKGFKLLILYTETLISSAFSSLSLFLSLFSGVPDIPFSSNSFTQDLNSISENSSYNSC